MLRVFQVPCGQDSTSYNAQGGVYIATVPSLICASTSMCSRGLLEHVHKSSWARPRRECRLGQSRELLLQLATCNTFA